MKRIEPAHVVEVCKKLDLKVARIEWISNTNFGYLCCGVGVMLAEKYGGAKEGAKALSAASDEASQKNCYTTIARMLDFEQRYLEDFTSGFDGFTTRSGPGAKDGADTYNALVNEGRVVERFFTEPDEDED